MKRSLKLVSLCAILALFLVPTAARADHTFFLNGFDSSAEYGDTATFTAQLMTTSCFFQPDPCPVSGAQVDFYVDDIFFGTDITNQGGFAFLLASSPNWHAGEHEIRAQYDRSSDPSDPATVLSTLTIAKEVSSLTARDGYIEAEVLDNDGTAVTGVAVRIDLIGPNGDTELCTAFTDAAGVARCTAVSGAGATPLNLDPNYRATFAGTGDYVGSSDTATII